MLVHEIIDQMRRESHSSASREEAANRIMHLNECGLSALQQTSEDYQKLDFQSRYENNDVDHNDLVIIFTTFMSTSSIELDKAKNSALRKIAEKREGA